MYEHIKELYQKKLAQYEAALADTKNQDNKFVFYRSLLALGVLGLLIYGYLKGLAAAYVLVIPLVILFLLLVNRHQKIRSELTYFENLTKINQRALQRLKGQWPGFSETGEQFVDPEHPYTSDLNIFGQGSLFQYLNTTNLITGEQALAKLLSQKTNCEDIGARQAAVRELSSQLDWRQHLQAIGMGSGAQAGDPTKLWLWAREQVFFLPSKALYLLTVLPITTWVLIFLMAFGLLPTYVPLGLLILQVLLVTVGQVFMGRAFQDTEKAVLELQRLAKLLAYIEGHNFQAPLLLELQKKLLRQNKSASQQVQALSRIASLINLRYSVFYHFINALFFCDLYTLRLLERWKEQYGMYLERWFHVIGQFEALASLATVAHDNPHWAFPQVEQGNPFFKAVELGHPLLNRDTRVCNDVSLPQPGTIHIITGSNMSGKSTLMRTVGINLVLAYAGAPVCAAELHCSKMQIYTSMRVQDSLEEGISSFYAELKRIKIIIEAAHLKAPLLFLLDEIFRGTNSRDRIAGARTVIKNLAQQNVIGFVTTHDLELGALAEECPEQISNFHFTDRIIDQTITFDYRLKVGISKTTNAIALMKMVGIEVDK